MQLQRIAIAPNQFQHRSIILTLNQQHYLSRVLRLNSGDRFIAMDGKGSWWLAEITGDSAQLLESIAVKTELPVAVTLMVALPKGNGFDDVVRSCTELGVSCIMPVISDRTLLNPSPHKVERWRRISQEAAEQSERQIIPTILDPIPFKQALSKLDPTASKYLCVARGDVPHLLSCSSSDSVSFVIAIGPEGGWTPDEVEGAIASSFQPVSLGKRILRAITAPIVALSLIAATLEIREN